MDKCTRCGSEFLADCFGASRTTCQSCCNKPSSHTLLPERSFEKPKLSSCHIYTDEGTNKECQIELSIEGPLVNMYVEDMMESTVIKLNIEQVSQMMVWFMKALKNMDKG